MCGVVLGCTWAYPIVKSMVRLHFSVEKRLELVLNVT